MRRHIYLVVGVFLLLTGMLLFANSFQNITGLVIVEDVNEINSGFAGALFIFAGLFSLFLSRRRARGQAAIEFLMTYGWAILAAVIVIGVLAFFGVFNPSKLTKGTIFLSPPFYSSAYVINDQGVLLEIKNPSPLDSTVSKVVVNLDGSTTSCTSSPSGPVTIKSGEVAVFFVPCSSTTGKMIKGNILMYYRKPNSNLIVTSRGTISGRVSSATYNSLTFYITGVGGISVACEGYGCSGAYGNGQTIQLVNGIPVTLTAIPAGGFIAWSGGCTGASTECNLFMTENKIVTANY